MPNPQTTAADNIFSVGSSTVITGGKGYAGGAGGMGISGNNAAITNSGSITGGEGSYSVNGSGQGGVGISGSALSITNRRTGSITGGEGEVGSSSGAGISGSSMMISNDGTIVGGYGSYGYGDNSGTSGIGGAGISGTDLTIINTYRITGGEGNSGGTGGDAISGSALTITNSGAILGGEGGYGYGENGGNGGAGISGSDMVIDNIAGGSITGGSGESGSVGGDAISGSALSITNGGTVTGGEGGFGYGESAGNAGAGISGSDMTINNLARGSVTGGEGGYGGLDGVGGAGKPTAGGAAILGDRLTITNAGTVTGGKGGFAGGETTGPNGADGGAGISGHQLTIDNMAGAAIVGGAGYYGGSSNSSGTHGGNGAAGITGDSLTMTNSGSIVGGKGSYGQNGGADGVGGAAISGSRLTIVNNNIITGGAPYRNGGEAGAAIDLTGGSNTLTLNTGSKITGDIVLADGDGDSATTLLIAHNDEANRAINGNLKLGQAASVTLTERPIEFSGNASFAEGASLTLGEGVSLRAASLTVEDNASLNASITHWDMQDILLVETTNGITGTFSYNNALVAGMNQPDFAYINAGDRVIKYSLYWNGLDAAAHGTFTLDEGRTFDLGVALNDNTAHINPAWDGKSLTKAGEGTLVLSAENAYTGSTDIREGMLKTTISNAFASTSGVTVGEEGTLNLNGNSQIVNALDNRGTLLIDDYGVPPSSPLSVVLTGNVTNSGNIILNNSVTSAGNTLTINGDYAGNDGSLMLGTVLGDDSSLTDKLVITGNASGTTHVQVNNENGAGALLHEGIKIIETGSSTADAFVQRGRIVAGSYEYRVTQGTASGGDMNNWYLTSMIDSPEADDPADPVDTTDPENNDRPVPDDTTVPENDDRPAPGRSPGAVNVYRPEGGSYASNLAAANTLFNTRLQDRQGGAWYSDPVTGEGHVTRLWLRTTGGRNKDRMSDDQNTSSSSRVVVQLGGALIQGSTNGMDDYQLGVMAGYGQQDNDTHNRLSGYRSRGEVSGYSAGLYGTWYQNAADKTGLYVDTWMLYNWFDNTVKGDELAEERYKSKGLTASLETGYTFHSGSFTTAGGWENNIYLRPQAQITWMGVKADDHTEKNGTRVQGLGDSNIQTRLGMRLSLSGKSGPEKGAVREFEPFIEANWIHNSKQYGVRMQETNTYLQGSRNIGEVKMGVEGRLTRDLSIWGNVAQQMGNNGFRDTSGVLGINYQF